MKDIKDYIHLYIGCEVIAPNPYYADDGIKLAKGILTGIHGEYGAEIQFIIDGNAEEEPAYDREFELKPVLRRLSSITEEEAREIWDSSMVNIGYMYNHCDRLLRSTNTIEVISPVLPKLLRMGFDLFGLIDSNLAIDSSTITENK